MACSFAASAVMPTVHISDEWLNEYSLGDSEEPRLGRVEEHLLICEGCRDRLTIFDRNNGRTEGNLFIIKQRFDRMDL